MDWSDGYVTDTQYTAGFYREMTPVFLTIAGLFTGSRMPDDGQPFTYCELGCGQGVGTAIMAAANPNGQFYGIDFNPGQIDNARRFAAAAGLENVTFIEASFAELLENKSEALTSFDYIALHGVYSWINSDNRQAILRFIEKTLKPGGAVYVSYNTLPGWTAMAPARRFMVEVAERKTGRSDIRAAAALDELDRLKEAGSRYFKANQSVEAQLKRARTLDKSYVTHEYLNASWHPLYVTDTIAEMTSAKLTYMGSATLVENLDTVFLPESLRQTSTSFGDVAFTELLKDFHSNKQFRRDIFVRGLNKLSTSNILELVKHFKFTLAVPHKSLKFNFSTILGDISGNKNIYEPLTEALDGTPLSVDELSKMPGIQIPVTDILQALCLLIYSSQVAVLRAKTPAAISAAHRFNEMILKEATRGRQLPYMVIPGSGLGMPLDLSHLSVLCAVAEGLHTMDTILPRMLALLGQNNLRLIKDGQPLTDPEAVTQEAKRQIGEVTTKLFPIWRRLEILPDTFFGS